MSKKPSFQREIERLEEIVRQLEGEELDLDRALALFEEGVQHLNTARELLERSEQTVRKVIAEAGGTVREEDVDV